MEKLPMCRICLVKNVRMYVVVNKNLHELYEKLTDIPFVTEDRRPILACFICCTQLKKCYRLLKKSLEAEELFAQILNEDFEPKPLINQDHFEFFHGFIKTPIENISIVEVGQTESVVVKEELQAVCEELDDILVPKEEHPSDGGLETVHQHNNYLEIEYMPPHQSELQSKDDISFMELKTEVEIEEVYEKKLRTTKTKRASIAKKPKLPTRRTKLEDTMTAELKKTDSKIIQNPQNQTSKPVTDTNQRVQNSINNTAVDIGYRTNSNQDFSCKIRHNKGSDSNGESYKCDVCQRSFSRKYNLMKHFRIHTGEKPYTCDVCQRSFRVKGELSVHTRTHTGEKPHKCDVCQRSFSKKDNLTRHIRIHTGEKPYTCDVCQRSFRLKGDHTVHVRKHTGEKPYECDTCQRSFNKKDNLIKHIRIHTGEKPYTCDVCQRSFRLKGDHTVHLRKHTGEKPYKCDTCQRRFRVKGELSAHTRRHTGEKPYKCNVCQRGFSRQSCLNKHIQLHSGGKPYTIHTGRKSFECEFCQRSFSAKSILTKHILTHTGEKPYKCETCLRSFKQIGTLKRHVRTHTGEKPYKCNVCHRAFGHLSSMKTHVSRVHPSE